MNHKITSQYFKHVIDPHVGTHIWIHNYTYRSQYTALKKAFKVKRTLK